MKSLREPFGRDDTKGGGCRVLRDWFKKSTPSIESEGAPRFATPHALPPAPPGEWRRAAHQLPDGAPLGEQMTAALIVELATRAATVVAGWRVPPLTGLHIRKDDLPDAWRERGNLLLTGRGDTRLRLMLDGRVPPSDALVVVSESAILAQAMLAGANSMIAIGDGGDMVATGLHVQDALLMTGARVWINAFASIDARNNGAVLIDEGSQLGAGLRVMTDDMHAIRDVASGRRINPRGGRIVIARNVWVGEQVMIAGESRIGAETVVGAGSFVKGRALPANSVCHGRPARPVRLGTTWTRADDP